MSFYTLSKNWKRKCSAPVSLCLLLLLPLVAFTSLKHEPWATMVKKGKFVQAGVAQEQIHLRFSQPYYAGGDTVRFKAYVLNVTSLQPTAQSQVLEIEFRTPTAATTQHHRFLIEGGMALGSFILPDSLARGQYEFVAYTPAMIPGGRKGAFQERIRVLGPISAKAKADASVAPTSVTLQAFPEGGKMVSGVQNRLAIKATDLTGKGVATKGQITGSGKPAIPFSTNKNGEGLVLFTPQTGEAYQLVLENENTSVVLKESKFPTVEPQGIAMRLQPGSDSLLQVRLLPNVAWLQKKGNKQVQVSFIAGNKTVLTIEEKLNKTEGTEIQVSRRKLPAGVLKVVVTNAEGQEEAQRLVLLQHPNQLRIHLKTDRIRYGRREPIRVTAMVTDAAGNPVQASLSFAVRSKLQAEDMHSSSLERKLLGDITPAQLSGRTNTHSLDSTLEWSLLTLPSLQGLRATPMGETSSEAQSVPFAGLQIEGRVVDDKGAPVEAATVLLYGKKSEEPMLYTLAPDGKFSFQSLDFVQPDQYTVEVIRSGARLRDAYIEWTNLPTFVPSAPLPLQLTEKEAYYLRQTAIRRQSEALFKAKAEVSQPEVKDTTAVLLSWLGAPDQAIDLSKYITFKNLEEVVKETLPLASVVDTDAGRQIRIFSPERTGAKFKEHPLYFLNGVPMLNNDWLLKLPGSSIKKINLYYAQRKLSNLGLIGRNGALSIYTKPTHPKPEEFRDHQTLLWTGLAPVHSFNTPSYEYTLPKPAPDFRSILAWVPKVTTDAKGVSSLLFYASDDIGDFEVEVEAFHKDGLVGTSHYLFTVTPTL